MTWRLRKQRANRDQDDAFRSFSLLESLAGARTSRWLGRVGGAPVRAVNMSVPHTLGSGNGRNKQSRHDPDSHELLNLVVRKSEALQSDPGMLTRSRRRSAYGRAALRKLKCGARILSAVCRILARRLQDSSLQLRESHERLLERTDTRRRNVCRVQLHLPLRG